MRGEGVPHTVDEARAYGWAWLTVRCLVCRRGHDLKFDLVAGRSPPMRLSALAARFYCRQCNGSFGRAALPGRTSAFEKRACGCERPHLDRRFSAALDRDNPSRC